MLKFTSQLKYNNKLLLLYVEMASLLNVNRMSVIWLQAPSTIEHSTTPPVKDRYYLL